MLVQLEYRWVLCKDYDRAALKTDVMWRSPNIPVVETCWSLDWFCLRLVLELSQLYAIMLSLMTIVWRIQMLCVEARWLSLSVNLIGDACWWRSTTWSMCYHALLWNLGLSHFFKALKLYECIVAWSNIWRPVNMKSCDLKSLILMLRFLCHINCDCCV